MSRYDAYLLRLERALPHLPPRQAHALLDAGAAVLIDVRDADEFAAGHIAGALNLPRARLESRIEEVVAPDQLVILACGSRGRSTIAAAVLRDVGWNAWVLQGGLQAWRAADLP